VGGSGLTWGFPVAPGEEQHVGMADDMWTVVHEERGALAADLAAVPDAQWSMPSLCTGWTVHDVLAHMVATAKMTPPKFLARMLAAGFRFSRFADKEIAVEGAGGPAATLASFRDVRTSTSAPPGPKLSWLGETLVHAEDIRRPLGISHAYPLPWVTKAIGFYAGSNALIGGKRRVEGLTLTATDTDWSRGAGPAVEGPAMALLLATTGRKAALDQLTGPGVDTLRTR
jgi:uncharacterized protein (TIGR03083 family)